ncbi:MAG TPA: class I SAM-dependent methyltransferase, partial [Spirochaetes bacterium]|nr:class I SAM-dependent methyltransferase [Spirochaetota bacterium]
MEIEKTGFDIDAVFTENPTDRHRYPFVLRDQKRPVGVDYTGFHGVSVESLRRKIALYSSKNIFATIFRQKTFDGAPPRILKRAMHKRVDCILCGSSDQRPLFAKKGPGDDSFTLVRCASCGLRFVSPRPDEKDIVRYYGSGYFSTRTERGYDNYFSPEIRGEIERIIALNLRDLGFSPFERSLNTPGRCLDIGCAAGYFVNYMRDRGWDASGIDVSRECVEFARDSLRLDVRRGDYLSTRFNGGFDLITLWATIEHLHHPHRFLEKIHSELNAGGRLYLSTCRAGGVNFMGLYGKKWRYYNFPEHLYFFSRTALYSLLKQTGFLPRRYVTYGSGFGKAGGVPRKIADFLA